MKYADECTSVMPCGCPEGKPDVDNCETCFAETVECEQCKAHAHEMHGGDGRLCVRCLKVEAVRLAIHGSDFCDVTFSHNRHWINVETRTVPTNSPPLFDVMMTPAARSVPNDWQYVSRGITLQQLDGAMDLALQIAGTDLVGVK